MTTKYEWKRQEKIYYIPGKNPQCIQLPTFQYFTIAGAGNPNKAFFTEYIQCLYSLSYTLKMTWKKEKGLDYAVYPLEGIWKIGASSREDIYGRLDKEALTFSLMIRQPDFITQVQAAEIVEKVKSKKPHPLLNDIKFEAISEGLCIQMLHIGSFDNESVSFYKMHLFAQQHGLTRINDMHKEIYLSDARKVKADKLRTILRFQVK